MNRMKHLVFALIGTVFGVLLFLAVGEIVLRFLPVNEGMRSMPVSADQPIFRFEPDREAVFSKGALFQIVNRVRSNNDGFISDQTYVADDPRPLLAVVGDSYVEALMVRSAETLHGRLAARLGDSGRVYAFGASGAGMAQYLVWAAHARDTYRPSALTVVIIPNDFSESLADRERSPGFHSFVRQPDGSAKLLLTEYRPSLVRRLLRESRLAMYLFSQLKIQYFFTTNLTLGDGDSRYVGNVDKDASEDYLAASRWAVDRFLDALPTYAGLPRDRIQLVVESVRPNLYDPQRLGDGQDSYWGKMRSYVIEQARARGHEAIDVNAVFAERYRQDGQRFEFPTDGHWNSHGHEVVAEAIWNSAIFNKVFNPK